MKQKNKRKTGIKGKNDLKAVRVSDKYLALIDKEAAEPQHNRSRQSHLDWILLQHFTNALGARKL